MRYLKGFSSFCKQLFQVLRNMYRTADRFDRVCLTITWTFLALTVVALAVPGFSLPLWAFLPCLIICVVAIVRGQLGFKKDMAVFDRLFELHKTGGTEADLTPAEQEWLKTIRAKRLLREQSRSDPGS